MSRYAFLIQAEPAALSSHRHAWQLAQALLAAGHEIPLLFFTGSSVALALASNDPPAQEWDPASAWRSLDIGGLVLCSSAAQRLGITDATICPGFRLGGLGEWVSIADDVDKVIQWR